MARYIGARYVPLYVGEWDNTLAYEPFSIVTYQGDSYTSIANVPVGAAITNTSYWIKTANFNQQLANIQTELPTLVADTISNTAWVDLTLATQSVFTDQEAGNKLRYRKIGPWVTVDINLEVASGGSLPSGGSVNLFTMPDAIKPDALISLGFPIYDSIQSTPLQIRFSGTNVQLVNSHSVALSSGFIAGSFTYFMDNKKE